MNTEKLSGIVAQYLQYIRTRSAAAEGSFWRAVDCFGAKWDLEAADFPAMLSEALQQAKLALDTPARQPIAGLQALMLRSNEVELVRECFRWLLNEDNSDYAKRRGRAELFADQINGRFRRVFPRMTRYTMTAADAVYFLNLWEPHDNYLYNAAEAKAWADYFEYAGDFGGAAALDLPRFYAMCEDLRSALADSTELIALHKSYLQQEAGGIEDCLHLLVDDLLHCAYTEQFYPKGYNRASAGKERAKAVQAQTDRQDLCRKIADCEQQLQELAAAPVKLPDLMGCRINHKMFGAGTVQPAEGQFMVIDFNGTLKKFSYTASMSSGYLSAEDPAVESQLQAYQKYTKEQESLEKSLKTMKAALMKL